MTPQHHVHLHHKDKMIFDANIDAHTIRMDAPVDGDISTAPSPKKLMLASLAGCTAVDVVSILHKMRVAFSDLQVKVDATLTSDYPVIYDQVEVHYYIKVNETDRSKVEKAVQLSEETYCGVMAMFKAFSKVSTKIHFE